MSIVWMDELGFLFYNDAIVSTIAKWNEMMVF